jgi:YfiH family protein
MHGRSGVLEVGLSDVAGTWFTGAAIEGVEDANLAHHRPHVPSHLAAARDRVAALTATDVATWHHMRQVHGPDVGVVDATTPTGAEIRGVDVLVTDVPERPLVVLSADCLPILAVGRRSVGVAHAGWRGLAADVPGSLVSALVRLGERPADIGVVIGPGIGPCCYAVGPEVVAAIVRVGGDVVGRTRSGEASVDLRSAARARLHALGVQDVREVARTDGPGAPCTACDEGWFSHRRDPASGRQAGIAMLRGPR